MRVKHKQDESSKPEPEAQGPDDFDWERDPAVILHDQAAVAAYFNKLSELVVKQRDTLGAPEATIFIAPENVASFLDGLAVRARPAPKKLRVVDGGAE